MKKNSLALPPRVYFLGSGHIAVHPLKKLFSSKRIDLIGIGTQADQPAGRKRTLQATPVGQWACENNATIDKLVSVNSEEFLCKLRMLKPDILFVASFGQLLKSEILSLPECACVNLHASLLPAYRGAAPIISAVVEGLTETGITFMQMDKGLDTGPVYCSFKQAITGERADELEEKLGILSATHIEDVIEKIVAGKLIAKQQDNTLASYSAKIKKTDGQLDWNDDAEVICRKIRGFYPWPGVYFTLHTPKKDIRITISEAEITENTPSAQASAGTTIVADKKQWIIACGQGFLELKKVKPEGKREMTGPEFVRGHNELFK